jgi:hypothetical protein
MATRPRTRLNAVPLSNPSPNNAAATAVPSQSQGGSSTGVPGSSLNPALSSQSGGTTQVQTLSSAGPTGSSSAGNAGNPGSAGTITASAASLTTPGAQPESQFWKWVQRIGGILGILGTFAAVIYFFFPYHAAIMANQLATNGNKLSDVANGWTRWAQCTAPGSVSILASFREIDLLNLSIRKLRMQLGVTSIKRLIRLIAIST